VASALGVNVSVAGLSLDSKQADKNILVAFSNAGCSVHESQEGLVIDGSNKKCFSFDATECPDLFPSLVAFASFCEGISIVKGVSRLKNKESDRGSVLQLECAKIGIRIDLKGDNMLIHGGGNVKGGNIHSHNDHRIAMAFGVIGLVSKEEIVIENPEVVSKSYPQFWEHLSLLKNNQ
jgi:3-phosphoshikimate 1-carboxyvinyltransferase